MSEDTKTFQIESAALSDRGLNERRPLNEDAYLHDRERSIFAVADGVGGAEAGEVASQTAIEVLDEAFRHQIDGTDVEDLMELAIQRANASIHQMAQEHTKFSMMATTIVALHLKGNIATFGHVGDSRLYRLTPDGQLHRETEDHSIVEEERLRHDVGVVHLRARRAEQAVERVGRRRDHLDACARRRATYIEHGLRGLRKAESGIALRGIGLRWIRCRRRTPPVPAASRRR